MGGRESSQPSYHEDDIEGGYGKVKAHEAALFFKGM